MSNAYLKVLFGLLALEVSVALIALLLTGSWAILTMIILIFGVLGGGGYLFRRTGLGALANWSDKSQKFRPTVAPTINNGSPAMVGINLGTGPERTEVVNMTLPLEQGISAIQIEVALGALRVSGKEGAKQIEIVATKRVFSRDEYQARNELDRLQVRYHREGSLIKIQAGPADGQTNLTIGRWARIDLEVTAPPALAAQFSTAAGDLVLRDYQGEVTARTNAGTLIVENYNSGRKLNLSSVAGRITGQQIAAGSIMARNQAGAIEFTGIGAESIELESSAGMVRARGVNCARYIARAQLGSVDLYDARIERELEMSATAGRVQIENVTANGFHVETTTGTIFYRGSAPLYNSSLKSALGTIELLLQPGGGFNLDARSNLGSVAVGLPIATTYSSSRNAFSGTIGVGGPQLQLQTQVGSIRVAQI